MKAVVAETFGGNWRLAEVPDPEPGPADVLVEIEASGVCFTDVYQLRDAAYGGTFPRIPGHEPVGRVIRCGDEVDELSVGDRVGVAFVQRWCGSCGYCALGRYEHCASTDATGVTVDGGHAQLAVIASRAVERVPEGLNPVEAAPVFCAGFTVYSGICDAELRPGERCAVVGVGGLGHLAVQYAAALGAEVFAVTRSARKRASLEDLGAHQVVVAEGSEIGDELRRRGGVDVLLHTANGIDPDLLRGLRPYGRVSLMGGSREPLTLTPTQMLFGKFRVMGSSQGPRSRLREALELHARVKARTVVEPFDLDDALKAYERVANGSPTFRVVLVP